jgi:methionine aminotransferase
LKLWNFVTKISKIIVLSDEVYEYITFEEKHISAHTRIKLLNRCVMVSFGKSFHVTGWKVGYLVAPEYLMKEIKKYISFWFQCQQSCQVAISEYLDVSG